MKATLFLCKNGKITEKKEFPTMLEANKNKKLYLQSFHITQRVKESIQAYIQTR